MISADPAADESSATAADEEICGGYRLRLKSAGAVGAAGRCTVLDTPFCFSTLNSQLNSQNTIFFYIDENCELFRTYWGRSVLFF